MSAPGWYPDPDGSPRLRYFDGRQWTRETANPPTSMPPSGWVPPTGAGAPGYQQPPHQMPSGPRASGPLASGPRAPGGRSHVLLWVAFGMVVVLILAVLGYLLLPPGDPVLRPSTTQTAEATPDATVPAPDPTSMSPESSTAPLELPPQGAVIEPLTNCPATATDAVGTQGADGRYASGAGLSMPAADGFVAGRVQYPWVHQSNSQVKQYDNNWMSSITVGTVRAEDGFTETGETAVAMAACMLGSQFYVSSDPTATVTGTARAPQGDGVQLSLDVAVPGAEGVTTDVLYIMTIKDLGVMHVVIATVPDTDPGAAEALVAVFAGMRVE
ncbi:DUF2510 domain-containing protein [Tessaracoccus sp.]